MGKFIKVLVVVVILLGVGVWFGVPAFLGTDFARERIQKGMAEGTGRDVELGDISFGWTSGLTVSNVTVQQKAGDHDADGPLFKLTGLSLDDSVGVAAQLGADWTFADHWSLNFDVRWINIETDATLTLDDGVNAPVAADVGTVEIDPWVYSINLGYRF